MYRRLVILSVVIVAAVYGLSGLGYHAITKWAQGLEGTRLAEFAEVAEQIRQDVKRKLDEFIRAEQQRKYTDYLYYYVPENVADNQQQQLVVLRSPLGDQWSNGLAYGYFQIEADGGIVTPYYPTRLAGMDKSRAVADDEVQRLVLNIENNVLPSITRRSGTLRLPEQQKQQQEAAAPSPAQARQNVNEQAPDAQMPSKGKGVLSKAYPIESLKQESQAPQVFTQQRSLVASNQAQTGPGPAQPPPDMQPAPNLPTDAVQTQKAEPAPGQQVAPALGQHAAPVQGGAVAQGPAAVTPQDRRGLPATTSSLQADLPQGRTSPRWCKSASSRSCRSSCPALSREAPSSAARSSCCGTSRSRTGTCSRASS